MIVNDFHVMRAIFAPFEADSPLPVDPNAIVSLSISAQDFQSIARKTCQVLQASCAIQGLEAAFRLSSETSESADSTTKVKRLGVFVAKISNHFPLALFLLYVTLNITQDFASSQL